MTDNTEKDIKSTPTLNKLPDWCKEKYCQSYDICKNIDPASNTEIPDCFYGRLENDTEINAIWIQLLIALGHTKECALQFIYEDNFDELGRMKCICHNTCATAFIDYDYYTTNFN